MVEKLSMYDLGRIEQIYDKERCNGNDENSESLNEQLERIDLPSDVSKSGLTRRLMEIERNGGRL